MPRELREKTPGGSHFANGIDGQIGAVVALPAAKADRSGGDIVCAIVTTRKLRWRKKLANCPLARQENFSEYFEKISSLLSLYK